MARTKTQGKAPVPQEIIDECLAKAVADGDMVSFRLLFLPFSPLRTDSTEDITTPKYAYLRADDDETPEYREAKMLVARNDIQSHVRAQLEKKGPAQLPSELVLKLADNAVRHNKLSTAAQAYEILRVRRRMQEVFYAEADGALDNGDIRRAVRGYLIAVGLEYDYAAFPEPLPAFARYQTRALMLHAVYPRRPEESLALLPPEAHLKMALNYLLANAEAAQRLESRSFDTLLDFLVELVQQLDPEWNAFASRYKEACGVVRALGQRLSQSNQQDWTEAQDEEADPREVCATMLGRTIPQGEWWQYLKELAYEHPASALFIARQLVGKDLEILMPRFLQGSPLVERLKLA